MTSESDDVCSEKCVSSDPNSDNLIAKNHDVVDVQPSFSNTRGDLIDVNSGGSQADQDADDPHVVANDVYNEFVQTLQIDDEFSDSHSSESESDSNSSDIEDEVNEALFYLEDFLGEWYTSVGTVARDSMNQLLAGLRSAGHVKLKKDTRSIVNTQKTTVVFPCHPGKYFYYGLETALTDILQYAKLPETIEIDINVDGLPITKSNDRTLWPIQGNIVGRFLPFIISVYHGNEKPADATEYLTPFIDDLVRLIENGLNYNNKNYFVKLRCIICDSPAKSFCKGCKQHNGYSSCTKCYINGVRKHNKMIF